MEEYAYNTAKKLTLQQEKKYQGSLPSEQTDAVCIEN